MSLYRQILGPAFDDLSPQVVALHDSTQARRWSGRAQVRRGSGVLAGLLAWLFGFPPSGDDVPVTVTLTPDAQGELWERDFAGSRFRSHQSAGSGRNAGLLVERFGPIAVALALVVEENRLKLIHQRWTFCRVPMPRFLLPKGEVFEEEAGGAFRFDVEIAVPGIGQIVAYRGELVQTTAKAAMPLLLQR